jgi:hypothetical protein
MEIYIRSLYISRNKKKPYSKEQMDKKILHLAIKSSSVLVMIPSYLIAKVGHRVCLRQESLLQTIKNRIL